MPVTIVDVLVQPDKVDEFIEACRINHEGSVREPGNRGFDVLQMTDDPAHFKLYEWFVADEDVAAHRLTAHYTGMAAARGRHHGPHPHRGEMPPRLAETEIGSLGVSWSGRRSRIRWSRWYS